VLRVFLVPENVILEAGDANGMEGTNNTTPAGWINVDENPLCCFSTWRNKSIDLVIHTSGNYNLVFLQ
jgi:hypothetical protein